MRQAYVGDGAEIGGKKRPFYSKHWIPNFRILTGLPPTSEVAEVVTIARNFSRVGQYRPVKPASS
jgi:hypothetical protein